MKGSKFACCTGHIVLVLLKFAFSFWSRWWKRRPTVRSTLLVT